MTWLQWNLLYLNKKFSVATSLENFFKPHFFRHSIKSADTTPCASRCPSKSPRFWLDSPGSNCTAHIPERWGLRVDSSCLGESIESVDFVFFSCTQKLSSKKLDDHDSWSPTFCNEKSRYPERPKVVGSETCSFWGIWYFHLQPSLLCFVPW